VTAVLGAFVNVYVNVYRVVVYRGLVAFGGHVKAKMQALRLAARHTLVITALSFHQANL